MITEKVQVQAEFKKAFHIARKILRAKKEPLSCEIHNYFNNVVFVLVLTASKNISARLYKVPLRFRLAFYRSITLVFKIHMPLNL